MIKYACSSMDELNFLYNVVNLKARLRLCQWGWGWGGGVGGGGGGIAIFTMELYINICFIVACDKGNMKLSWKGLALGFISCTNHHIQPSGTT